MSASFRRGDVGGNSAADLQMTPSMHTTHDLRNVAVEVERAGPGMFRLSAKPDCAGSYYMRAAVGSLAADVPILQVLNCRMHCRHMHAHVTCACSCTYVITLIRTVT